MSKRIAALGAIQLGGQTCADAKKPGCGSAILPLRGLVDGTTIQTAADLGAEAARGRLLFNWRGLLLAGLVLLLYTPVLWPLFQDWWKDANYSHGIFVPMLSAYLIWNKRLHLQQLRLQPRLRLLAFPLGFLFLMVPLPAIIYNQIVFPLQLLASRTATVCLQESRIFPVLREGNVLVLPRSRIEVVEACSGIRSLMSLITLAAAYGYLVERKNWIRALLVAAMFPVAVISNATRVMVAAIMTQYWGPEAGEGIVHFLSGIVLFLVSIALLLLLHFGLRAAARLLSPRPEAA